MEIENSELPNNRELRGWQAFLLSGLLILITLSGIAFILSFTDLLGLSLMRQQYAGWFMGLVLAAVFIGIPATKKVSAKTHVPWYDWIFSLTGLVCGLYIAINYQTLLYQFALISNFRLFLAASTIILVLEALRRIFGWTLVIVVLLFLGYGLVAPYMPGMLRGQETQFKQLLNYLYLDTNSLLDLLYLAASMGLAFILFGQVLLQFKGGDIFNDIAIKLFGKYRGGPAKASVVGSTAIGSVTGSPVVNVMLTGSMTIPLMKRSGYTSSQAGAIEAVASTGGSITPPIMGIVAFMIAENLGVPYQEVVLAALIPAILYYLSLFIQVDLKAGQNGAGRVPKELIPSKMHVLKTGWLMIPIFFFLIYFLFVQGLPAQTAGVNASGVALLVLIIQSQVRHNLLGRIVSVLKDTGKTMLEIGVILAAAGLIVGVIGITGLGFNLVQTITSFGTSGLLVLLIASAVVCIILGMGMPAVAAYSIVAVLIAPAMIDLGVTPMAAHMFVLFFATVSNFTPPIALACFAAAPIAKENPHKIGFTATKLGIMGYVLPFIFVYNSAILLGPSPEAGMMTVAISILFVVIGISILSVAVAGYLFKDLSWMKRAILTILSAAIMIPINSEAGWLINTVACIVALAVFLQEWLAKRKACDGNTEGQKQAYDIG